MKRSLIGGLALGALAVFVVTVVSQWPGRGTREGPGRGGPPPRFELGHAFPPFIREQLELTREQEKQIASLEKEVKERLLKILTPEQQKRIADIRPPQLEGLPGDDTNNLLSGGLDQPPQRKERPGSISRPERPREPRLSSKGPKGDTKPLPPDAEEKPSEGRKEDAQPLTAEQKAQVKEILSKYNASSLTAKDAKAINDAFRSAGLRNGPALQDAIRDSGFAPERMGELDPPPDQPREGGPPANKPSRGRPGEEGDPDKPPRPEQGGGYSIEQAISDRAQLHTLAFDGLAFLTGDFGSSTFLPPGKVADFSGFQYMRHRHPPAGP